MSHNDQQWPKIFTLWAIMTQNFVNCFTVTQNKVLGLFIFLNFVPKILFGTNFVPKLENVFFKFKLNIQGCRFCIQQLFFWITSLKYLFWTDFVLKLQSALFRMKIPKKRYSEMIIPKTFWMDWTQHPRTPLYTEIHFKQSTLKFWDQIFPKKRILRRKFEKTILEFRIYTLEYPFVLSFILNKALWSFGTKFVQKIILAREFEKKYFELKISSLEYPFVPIFILNKAVWGFETKFAPKEVFKGWNLREQLWNSELIFHLWIPLCTDFHSKQNTLTFWDQNFPKMFHGQNFKKWLLNSKPTLNTSLYQVPF